MKPYTPKEELKKMVDIKIFHLYENNKLYELTNDKLDKYIKVMKELLEKFGRNCKNIDTIEIIEYAKKYHNYLATLPKNARGVSLLNPESPYNY